MNIALLSIKPEFAERILARTKTIELRKSCMGFFPGDVIVFYVSSPKQELSFCCRIAEIERLDVQKMWEKNHDILGIDTFRYQQYFGSSNEAFGFHLEDVSAIVPPIPLKTISELVPGFTPPQGFIWLSKNSNKYNMLLDLINKRTQEEHLQPLFINTPPEQLHLFGERLLSTRVSDIPSTPA